MTEAPAERRAREREAERVALQELQRLLAVGEIGPGRYVVTVAEEVELVRP